MSVPIDFEKFYRVLRDISVSVHSGIHVKDVLDTVVKNSAEALNAMGAIIRILNLETHKLELGAAYGLGRKYLSKGAASQENLITDLYQQDKVIIIRDILHDPRVKFPKEAWDEGIRMMLDVPLSFGKDIIGILRFYFSESKDLSEEELGFVVPIAQQGAFAIEKARLMEEQKSQYDQLALQTEKLSSLGRMAAGIAHEINNPLGGILLFSSNMLKKVPEEGPLRDGLDIIVQETKRCKTIIQGLLEFSRESEPQMVLADINEILEKALYMLDNEFRLHYINVEKELTAEMADTLLDKSQITQVVVNILLNAVQAIGEKGSIIVRSYTNRNQKKIIVEISDNGSGILSENVPKIFDPFFSTKPGGTGLGLAVSYGIIQRHNGQIHTFSRPGKGTRFVIEVPVAKSTHSKHNAKYGNTIN
jgi:signal transduction histidine kinase